MIEFKNGFFLWRIYEAAVHLDSGPEAYQEHEENAEEGGVDVLFCIVNSGSIRAPFELLQLPLRANLSQNGLTHFSVQRERTKWKSCSL